MTTDSSVAVEEWALLATDMLTMRSLPVQPKMLTLAEAHARETEAWMRYLHAQGLDTRAISLLDTVTPQEQQAAA